MIHPLSNVVSAIPWLDATAGTLIQLPIIRQMLQRRYLREFARPMQGGNRYYGVFPDHARAREFASGLVAPGIPTDYDTEAAGRLYRSELGRLQFADYPVLLWLEHLFAAGSRRVFDLGGNIGVAYYALAPRLGWPQGLRWTVHDMPAVMGVGRKVAQREDTHGALDFSPDRHDASGHDILLVAGTLQYLDFDLAQLLATLPAPPRHVLVTNTPMHPEREYHTLQNLGVAICPYHVFRKPDFIAAMASAGYRLCEEWLNCERRLSVPFHEDVSVEGYSGACFERRPQ